MSGSSRRLNAIDQKAVWQIKLEAKALIDAIELPKRRDFINAQLAELEENPDPINLIRQVVYLIHLILTDIQFPSMRHSEFNQLTKKVYSILMLAGIKPNHSHLSGLYGELHLALAQYNRRAGKHVAAFWQHQLSVVQSRRDPVGGESFQLINLAIRAERLGQYLLGRRYFEAALACATQAKDIAKIRLHLLRQARATGQWPEFEQLAKLLSDDEATPEAARTELVWELAIQRALQSKEFEPILKLLAKESPHYSLSYISEAKLLSFATQSATLLNELPKMASFQRNLAIKKAQKDARIDLISTLENSYDSEVPFAIRMRDLGESFERLAELPTIDLELLAWCGAARWLARNNNYEMANFCIAEYHAINWRLTAGQSGDPNHLMADLLEKSWCEVGKLMPLLIRNSA